uniref:uncharacterized protein n=1 Tax=Centroberyx gerrardi TaxID=166262 RepID=UPI003AAEE30E
MSRWEEDRERKRGEESKKEKLEQGQETLPGSSSVPNNQQVVNSQSNDWPPLREAELDEIAYEERLEGDSEESECKSDPRSVNKIDPNAEGKTVLNKAEIPDSLPEARPKNKPDSRPAEITDSNIAANEALDKPGPRSVKRGKSNLKSSAVPVWMREEEDEEVEYERGQEDLGTVWLAELYMDGEGGPDHPSSSTPAVTQNPFYHPSSEQALYQGSAVNPPNKSKDALTSQTHTPEPKPLTKDQRLQEEERILLAKIRLLTGDTLPLPGPRGKKRLIPDLHDIDSDATEPKSQSEISTDPRTAAFWKTADQGQSSIASCFTALEEISLADAEEEPVANELGEASVVREEEGLKQEVKEQA